MEMAAPACHQARGNWAAIADGSALAKSRAISQQQSSTTGEIELSSASEEIDLRSPCIDARQRATLRRRFAVARLCSYSSTWTCRLPARWR